MCVCMPLPETSDGREEERWQPNGEDVGCEALLRFAAQQLKVLGTEAQHVPAQVIAQTQSAERRGAMRTTLERTSR